MKLRNSINAIVVKNSKKGKKPKNSFNALVVKNAKKGKVSKTQGVRYLNAEEVKNFLGIRVNPMGKKEMKERKF